MKRKEAILSFGLLMLCLFLMYKGYVYWAAFIIFWHCLYRFLPISQQVLRIFRSAFAINFYNIVIWFLSYVLSLKFLSFVTGIEEDNLKFAPVILAVPLSFVIIFTITMLISVLFIIIVHITHQIILFFPEKLRVLARDSHVVNFAERFPNITFLMMPFLLILLMLLPLFVKVGLLADATFVSDCGVKSNNIMYLRIDNEKCYKYTIDRFVFTKDPIVIKNNEK